MPLTLAAIPAWLLGLLVVLFFFISVALILVVLIQRPQGGGLSGAFGAGGQGSGQTVFGAKTGDALTIATIGVFLLYLVTAIGLNWAVDAPPPTRPAAQATEEVPAGATGPTGEEVEDPGGADSAVRDESQTVPDATPPGEGESFVTDPLEAEGAPETPQGEQAGDQQQGGGEPPSDETPGEGGGG